MAAGALKPSPVSSECFTGKGLTVRWTSEELGLLYHACATLGSLHWELMEEKAVLAWMLQQHRAGTPGQMAFSLDHPPQDFASPESRRFLARLVEMVAHELALPEPDPRALGMGWERDGRLMWLARLGGMYETVRRTSPDVTLPDYSLLLTGQDLAECQMFLYLSYYDELCLMSSPPLKEKLAFIDSILTMVAEAGVERQRVALLSRLRAEREAVVEALGLNQHRRLTDHQRIGRRAEDLA